MIIKYNSYIYTYLGRKPLYYNNFFIFENISIINICTDSPIYCWHWRTFWPPHFPILSMDTIICISLKSIIIMKLYGTLFFVDQQKQLWREIYFVASLGYLRYVGKAQNFIFLLISNLANNIKAFLLIKFSLCQFNQLAEQHYYLRSLIKITLPCHIEKLLEYLVPKN